MSLQLRSTVNADGTVEVGLAQVPDPTPAADEVVVRVEAAPINPSDLAMLFASADLSKAKVGGTKELPSVIAPLNEAAMRAAASRVGQAVPVGIEGAGVVIAAGASKEAQALLGKRVGVMGGGTYAALRCAKAWMCEPLPDDVTFAQGAAWYVNPVTTLCMLETARRENHKALVHTAAASNLGQMLVRLCEAENVPLVNIVRKPDQVATLKALGAKHVVDSSQPGFRSALTEAVVATQATLAFDAIGGGTLAGDILSAMEVAASKVQPGYRRYGTTIHKQVYLYGWLNEGPTELSRAYGMAWGVGAWLLTNEIEKMGRERGTALRVRAVSQLSTTFESRYAKEISLAEMVRPEVIAAYAAKTTGAKYLARPAA